MLLGTAGAVSAASPLDGPSLRTPHAVPQRLASAAALDLQSPNIDVAEVFAEPLPVAPVDLPWEETPLATEAPETDGWSPPSWFPTDDAEALWALQTMSHTEGEADQGPSLKSRVAFVYDLDADEVLLSRGADERRPVASLTKLVSALTLVSEDHDLDRELCLDQSHRPSWPGAVSRLRKGTCTRGWDLLGIALVRSDNGAALSFASIANLPLVAFVDRMGEVAGELGMDQSSFADPTGIFDENLSTARDMTRAVVAASAHPDLAPVLDAPYWDVTDARQDSTRRYRSTNRLLRSKKKVQVLAAKTGYTDTARHCFSGVIIDQRGHRIALTVMGARWSKWRWRDVNEILDWTAKRS